MNYYGNSSYSHLHQQLNQLQQQQQELQQNQQQHRSDYFSSAGAGSSSSLFPAPLAELAPSQHSQSHLKLQQNQTVFHCRVRDLYFSSWQGQQQHTHHHHQQHHQHHHHRTQQLQQQRQSVWQGHKNARVYEGDEVHCFNSYCHMTFRFPQQLVQHIVHGECGVITVEDVEGIVRDWRSLQVELGRCGKLSGDENACLERASDLLQGEQAKSGEGSVSQELVGYLVLAWEILTKNRSMYTLI
ncbi:hypothetical protein R1sor_015087 [Riccia sorocarpa]|uniref:Uncharacterized protein n=1 Tax=Riccia sorocarpa TaxID=122646 RepID=A0ABD3HBP3_9MARC